MAPHYARLIFEVEGIAFCGYLPMCEVCVELYRKEARARLEESKAKFESL